MSTDTLLDFSAAAVVFGSVVVIAYRDEIWRQVRKIFRHHDATPKPPTGMLFE